MVHRKKSPPPKDIALERIVLLHSIAEQSRNSAPELSSRYMTLAETIAKRMDMSLPLGIKRSYCKKCGHCYDTSSRVRIRKGLCTVTCGHCQDIRRIPYRN